jgi:hypothetical protein
VIGSNEEHRLAAAVYDTNAEYAFCLPGHAGSEDVVANAGFALANSSICCRGLALTVELANKRIERIENMIFVECFPYAQRKQSDRHQW